MRKWSVIILLALSVMSVRAAISSGPIRVNGVEPDKTITEVVMDDQTVTFRWNDNTTTKGRAALLIMRLVGGGCIDKVRVFSVSGFQGNTLSIDGLETGLLSVYDLQGHELFIQQVIDPSTKVDISQLNTGIYLLKNNSTILKFVKK